MKYELVALFDRESCPKLENIQRRICKKYRVYKCTPSMYISFNIISNPDIEKLDKVITKIINPYKKFKVNMLNEIYVSNKTKQTGVIVDEKGYISRIARSLKDTLLLHEFDLNSISEDETYPNLIIPVANCNYNIKRAANQSPLSVSKSLSFNESLDFAKVERLELWKLNGNRKDSVAKIFNLKEY